MRLLWIFAFGLWAAKFCVEKSSLVVIPGFKWLIALASVMIIASLAGTDVLNSFYALKTYLPLFLIFFLVTQVFREPKDLFLTGWILIVSLSIFALWFSIDYLQFIGLGGGFAPVDSEKIHVMSIASLSKDPNVSALYFSLAIPLVLYYLMIYKKDILKRVLLIICLAVLIIGIVITHSMGGAIGLISVMILFVLLRKKITPRKKILLLAFLIPVFLTMYSLAPDTFKSRAQSKYFDVMDEDFTTWGSGRGGCWLAAINVIKENPFLGVSIGDYLSSMGQQSRQITGTSKEFVAHNSFLAIAAQSGLLALLFFILLIYSILKRLSEKLKRFPMDQNFLYLGSAIYLSLITFLIQALFLDIEMNRYLYLLLAFAATFTNIVENKYRTECLKNVLNQENFHRTHLSEP